MGFLMCHRLCRVSSDYDVEGLLYLYSIMIYSNISASLIAFLIGGCAREEHIFVVNSDHWLLFELMPFIWFLHDLKAI